MRRIRDAGARIVSVEPTKVDADAIIEGANVNVWPTHLFLLISDKDVEGRFSSISGRFLAGGSRRSNKRPSGSSQEPSKRANGRIGRKRPSMTQKLKMEIFSRFLLEKTGEKVGTVKFPGGCFIVIYKSI